VTAQPPSSIPFLALGAWMLTVGWFGFNVMSAQTIDKISGWSRQLADGDDGRHARRAGHRPQRSGLRAQRPLAGLVADLRRIRRDASDRRAGDRAVAGALFVWMFTLTQNR
jgi:ammonium transporter, Amt family